MTEQKEQDHADFCFLQGVIPDMKKLSDRRKRKFKLLMVGCWLKTKMQTMPQIMLVDSSIPLQLIFCNRLM